MPPSERRPKLLYNVGEAAEQLGGISTRTLYALIRSGELESVTIGSRRLVPDAALEEYVEKLRAKASEEPLSPREAALAQTRERVVRQRQRRPRRAQP
ncbi:helix-turn-helix domain-containing protein [Micromonospora aurantiaca]|nr:helix-turn-helix domain-containing protein [Micromonospora aurantiaca]